MSVDDQNKEIERIKNAHVGDVLFTVATCSNTDVVDTLLHMSGVQYHVGVANYTAKYYKVA
jgi:hypothetical protein